MSDVFPLFDGDDSDGNRDDGDRDDGGDRGDGRRSAWTALTVLAFAVTVVVLATLLLRSSGGSHHPDQLAGPSGLTSSSPTPTAVTQSGAPSDVSSTSSPTSSTSRSASKSPTPSASKSTSKTATPSRTPTPSRSSSVRASPTPTPTPSTSSPASCPCSIPGDGGAIGALDKVRRDAHPRLHAAQGSVTSAAKSCAESLALGATTFCPSGYARAEETSQDGQAAVADAYSNGGSWFTDPNLQSFEVGWAYDGAGHYYCVFIEN